MSGQASSATPKNTGKVGTGQVSEAFRAQIGKGRPKGAKNKSTIAVKQALIDAFEAMGGVARLTEFAKEKPDEFYKLWVKMLPTEVSGPDGGPVQVAKIELVGVAPE